VSVIPAGTVTFLFTDIEGSTRLWQDHPDAMPDALARHDALARDAIASRGGHLFKHTGDGVCAAFPDAAAAVEAAVILQHSLEDAVWDDGPRPRVRMALDSGPAQRRDADYFGPTLNRVARVLAVGSSGQILATVATIALAPGVDTIDLGLHRLRDLGEPVRLHQVTAPGLEHAFPALRSLDRFRHSLPVVRSSFVGREDEIARLRRLLVAARLLTITGVGGCGKTRLALALASQELDRFPEGVFFVDLSAVSDPGVVWGAIAGALGIVGGAVGGLSPRELVLGRLTDTIALVVLDNCEHLLDACAEIVAALVDRSGSVAILATSREPLGVEGEQVFRVPSLALPADDASATSSEAVRLFVERATAVDAAFALTPDITPTVIEICRRLDGIPLAIELAAARVRHLPVAEIARRLDDRFRLLTGGPRGARQRQQTLAAALDWSFQLLGERERTLLRRCAVFVDGFSLEAAEGVCAGDGLAHEDVVDVLGALVDKSLVSLHAAEHRYRLLETIRLYAQERLVEAGETEVRARHLAWFQQAYEALPLDAMAPATLDVGNLRAARVWAHETRDGERVARLTRALFWRSRVYDPAMLEERAWCEVALAYEGLAPDLHAETLAVASFRDIGAGDWPAAIEHARRAIALAVEPGEGVVAGAYFTLAIALMVTDPDAADRAIDEGIAHVRRARAPGFSETFLAGSRVSTALMRGDAARALELARGAESLPAVVADNLGMEYALHLLGDHAAAEAAAARHSMSRERGLRTHSFHLLFALTAAACARWEDAWRELAAAATFMRRYRYPLTLCDCVVVCGALAAIEGRLERASVLLAAVVDRSFVRTPEMWAVYLHYRGIVRAGLDAATIRRCREEARTVDLERALDEELARHGAS
jgi:predicted ATPase/class 3 adenylate cyclase